MNIMSRKITLMGILINPVAIRSNRLADIEPNMKAYTIRNRAGVRRLTGLHGHSSTSENNIEITACKRKK